MFHDNVHIFDSIGCRLTKAQLDGACGDSRFDQDFFVDLIFADVETDGATENGGGSEMSCVGELKGLELILN